MAGKKKPSQPHPKKMTHQCSADSLGAGGVVNHISPTFVTSKQIKQQFMHVGKGWPTCVDGCRFVSEAKGDFCYCVHWIAPTEPNGSAEDCVFADLTRTRKQHTQNALFCQQY